MYYETRSYIFKINYIHMIDCLHICLHGSYFVRRFTYTIYFPLEFSGLDIFNFPCGAGRVSVCREA